MATYTDVLIQRSPGATARKLIEVSTEGLNAIAFAFIRNLLRLMATIMVFKCNDTFALKSNNFFAFKRNTFAIEHNTFAIKRKTLR